MKYQAEENKLYTIPFHSSVPPPPVSLSPKIVPSVFYPWPGQTVETAVPPKCGQQDVSGPGDCPGPLWLLPGSPGQYAAGSGSVMYTIGELM